MGEGFCGRTEEHPKGYGGEGKFLYVLAMGKEGTHGGCKGGRHTIVKEIILSCVKILR